jgi:hypothetical protein
VIIILFLLFVFSKSYMINMLVMFLMLAVHPIETGSS